jgi:hypothetical protein
MNSIQHIDPKMFNPSQAAGSYHLNLSDPYERAIAEELLQLARNIARQSSQHQRDNNESNGSDSSDGKLTGYGLHFFFYNRLCF